MEDIPRRRKEVLKLSGLMEPWEIARRLQLTERVVNSDITYLEKKIDAEKIQLQHLTRTLSALKEAYGNYEKEKEPGAIHWWDRFAAMNKQLGETIRKADIIFLQNNVGEQLNSEEKGVIAQLREFQIEGEKERAKKKKQEVMK